MKISEIDHFEALYRLDGRGKKLDRALLLNRPLSDRPEAFPIPAHEIEGLREALNLRDDEFRFSLNHSVDDLREGKYLILEINLEHDKHKIWEVVSKYIDLYSKFAKKGPAKRIKETIYDPWMIYDLHKDDKLNFTQIAQKLSGIKGNPNSDAQLGACYKNVKRAHEKAENAIKYIKMIIEGGE